MRLGIGIDTGGTCTDAVLYDLDSQKILAKGKSLTTKEDLTIGISKVLDTLPHDLLDQVNIINLSTTLPTNACVEDKGGRSKLILIGSSRKVLDWIDAKSKYGINNDNVYCLNNVEELKALGSDFDEWIRDADSLSIAELNANFNGAIYEKEAYKILSEKYDFPIILASQLVNDLNVIERGATALLNARLLPVIQYFMHSVKQVLKEKGLDVPTMIIRSDGSLMNDQLSMQKPVETILSGPATSILGGKSLTQSQNSLIIDMGGTTTDISIVKNDRPAMTETGIRIGDWRTQVKGVFIDTFALGGDTGVIIKNGKPELSTRRALPYCVAAVQWPKIKEDLKSLLDETRIFSYSQAEFFYLVNEPEDLSHFNKYEVAFCKALKDGPCMYGNLRKLHNIDVYNLNTQRLEAEGFVMRISLTPTDIMHIKGDFTMYDSEASELAAKVFLQILSHYNQASNPIDLFANDVYDLVKFRLYENIIKVLLINSNPSVFEKGMDKQLRQLIKTSWEHFKATGEENFFSCKFQTIASLVAIGAPTYLFLPDVARALGTSCIVPENAEVANAVGAIVANISTKAKIEIRPNYTHRGIAGYTIFTPDGTKSFEELEESKEAAMESAIKAATIEARKRGALGELKVESNFTSSKAYAKEGQEIDLGTTATAIVKSF